MQRIFALVVTGSVTTLHYFVLVVFKILAMVASASPSCSLLLVESGILSLLTTVESLIDVHYDFGQRQLYTFSMRVFPIRRRRILCFEIINISIANYLVEARTGGLVFLHGGIYVYVPRVEMVIDLYFLVGRIADLIKLLWLLDRRHFCILMLHLSGIYCLLDFLLRYMGNFRNFYDNARMLSYK